MRKTTDKKATEGSQAQRVYNFNSSVGQFIEHVDTVNFTLDGNGQFHFNNVENVNEKKKEMSNEQLARAIENTQELFWGKSAYAVVFCLIRDDYKKEMTQTAFESMVELLPYQKVRDYTCSTGTIANAFSDNPIFKTHVSRWEAQGASNRILKLLNKLREELKL